ncbi:MAG: hypothetical protein GPJ09_14620 [Microcystis aeruginosa SX13-01]|nr:hypothetical protein [Microcystis aeruginosa SX13-01]
MVSQVNKTEIIYPESDGKPMADNTKQFHWIVTIKQNLDWLYIDDPQVFVAGDLLWYPVEGQPKIAAAPDTMVVFGRPKGDRGSYKQWQEDNLPPQVVFDQEYYVYDPDDNSLEAWQRIGDSLDSVSEVNNWVSPRLGIRFDLTDELKIYRPDGTQFLSYSEINQLLEQEKQRAENERQRAENERQRAENERKRAEQANQQLLEMEAKLQKYRQLFGELPN